MQQKSLIAVVGVLVLVIIGLVYYFLFWQKGEAGGPGGSGGFQSVITSAHLEMFPIGTQMGPGLSGTETTVFRSGELMGLSGEVNIVGTAKLTVQILDASGQVVRAGMEMNLTGAGGFGMCCFPFPDTVGTYTMKLFVDSVESKTLPFQVVA